MAACRLSPHQRLRVPRRISTSGLSRCRCSCHAPRPKSPGRRAISNCLQIRTLGGLDLRIEAGSNKEGTRRESDNKSPGSLVRPLPQSEALAKHLLQHEVCLAADTSLNSHASKAETPIVIDEAPGKPERWPQTFSSVATSGTETRAGRIGFECILDRTRAVDGVSRPMSSERGPETT